MATVASRIEVQKLYISYFGRPADETGLVFYGDSLDGLTGAALTTAIEAIATGFGTSAEAAAIVALSTANYISAVYLQAFGRAYDATTDGTFWTDAITAGTTTKEKAMVEILNGASGDDSTAVANKLEVAQTFSAAVLAGGKDYAGTAAAAAAKAVLDGVTAVPATKTSGNTAATDASDALSVASAGVGTTFVLTTASDNITGTAQDDTFIAGVDGDTAANNTLSAIDAITGGAGKDKINIVFDTDANAVVTPTFTNSGIEEWNIRNVSGQTVTLSGSAISDEETLNSNLSTSIVAFTNVADSTLVKVTGDGSVTNAASSATFVAAATTGKLTIDGGATAGNIAMNGAGLTSLTVNSTGAANVVGGISSTGANIITTTVNAAVALTTTGLTVGTSASTQSLVVSGVAVDKVATATAGETAAVVLGTLDNDFASVDASGLTLGGVFASLNTGVASTFVGGLGNDTIVTTNNLQTGTIAAGAGTDTLILGNSAHISTTLEGAVYTGFETLSANGQDLDMDLFTGSTITSVTIGGTGSAITDMTVAQGGAVTFAGAVGTTTLGIKDATTVGTNNTLAITVTDGDTTTSEAGMATGVLTIAGVETINITATDDLVVTDMSAVTGMSSLTVTGVGNASVITTAMALESNTAISFSGLSGANTFNAAAATGNAFAFTGGSGVDAVTDNVVNGNVITTGAGNDTLTLTAKTTGTGTTTVNNGAGADVVTYNQIGNDAADGNVLFQFAAGDSVSDTSTTGISATLTDIITTMNGATLASTAGTTAEFDTEVQATAITFAAATNPTFGTTTVTNAGDFFINIVSATVTNIYQDTDGDSIIEAGEFAITLTGIAGDTLLVGDFAVTSGDLIMATT
jgi:hypothetical protein